MKSPSWSGTFVTAFSFFTRGFRKDRAGVKIYPRALFPRFPLATPPYLLCIPPPFFVERSPPFDSRIGWRRWLRIGTHSIFCLLVTNVTPQASAFPQDIFSVYIVSLLPFPRSDEAFCHEDFWISQHDLAVARLRILYDSFLPFRIFLYTTKVSSEYSFFLLPTTDLVRAPPFLLTRTHHDQPPFPSLFCL